MKMLTNCPLGKKETHACWGCIFSTPIHNDEGEVTDYFCHHKDYKETIKVKPRKIKPEVFCIKCNKKVKFRIEEEGCASVTPKGVMFYNELYAYCPHCYREVYVPAVNDINVRSRQKAFKELPEITREEVQGGIDALIKMFEDKDNENNKTTMS